MNYQPNYGYPNSPVAPQQLGQSMGASVNSLAVSTANGVNYMLQNNYVRVFVFMLAAVYAGYTLTPVPKNLQNLFRDSEVFKYFVLFFIGASMLHPLDETKVKLCLIVPLFVLFLFRMLRNQSSGKHLFDGIGFRRKSKSELDFSDSDTDTKAKIRGEKKLKKKDKKDKKDKKSPCSDSVKGMEKVERFAII